MEKNIGTPKTEAEMSTMTEAEMRALQDIIFDELSTCIENISDKYRGPIGVILVVKVLEDYLGMLIPIIRNADPALAKKLVRSIKQSIK